MANKKGVAYWHKKVWKVYSRYIRMRDYANQTNPDPYKAPCFSCGKPYPIAGVGCLQAGHFITRKKLSVRYDEKNVHSQCYNCNVNLKGNWDGYYDQMKKVYGQEAIDDLMQKRFDITLYKPYELEQMYDDYMAKLGELTDQHGNPFKS